MENYWKVQEVAAVLQISVQTVYRYVAEGEIPCHKVFKSVRFKPSEIERWVESKAARLKAARSKSLDESAETEGGEV